MTSLISLVILALVFGYFATQNSTLISPTLFNYTFTNVPMYIVIGVTLLVGLLMSWIISMIQSIATTMKMRGKEHAIKDAKSTIQDMNKRINDLEIENARLRGETKKNDVVVSTNENVEERKDKSVSFPNFGKK